MNLNREMGSFGCLGALAPNFLGLQADGARMEEVSGGNEDAMMKQQQPPTDSEWHSISLDNSSKTGLEYCFKLVERKDGSDKRTSLFGSKEVSQQTRKLELSLCTSIKGDEGKSLVSYPDGLKKDCSYITMEALDSSNGVKEVRVSFHGLEDSSKKVGSEKGLGLGLSPSSNHHDMGYGDDGCLSLVSQFRALFSPTKPSCGAGGLFHGDSKQSFFDGLGSLLHSFKTSDSSLPVTDAKEEFNPKARPNTAGSQEEYRLAPNPDCTKTSSTGGCRQSHQHPKRALFGARDPQSRSDALPLAHYRPDGPAWCSRDAEQKDGATTAPSANTNSPVHINCKKPPKPPKPPRHPGRATSLDSAMIAAQRAAALKKKIKQQAAAKRKARVSALNFANSGGTPFIALALTLGFGILMVFQGLFVQSNATYGNSDKAFVDVPSGDQFGQFSAEEDNSYGYPYQIDAGVQSSNQVADPGKVDMVISNAFFKSMQEIQSSGSSHAYDLTTSTASG